MKKILSLLIVICLFSCSKSKKEILEQNIEAYVKNNAKDPSSYEPIETEILDTIYVKDIVNPEINSIKDEIELTNKKIGDEEERINKLTKHIKDGKQPGLNESFNNMIKMQESLIETLKSKNKNNQNRISQLENLASQNDIAYIISSHKCRSKNGFGALDIRKFYIISDDRHNIINANSNKKILLLRTYEKFKEEKFPVE